VLWLVREALHRLIRALMRGRVNARARFWAHQSLNLAAAFLLLLGVLSLWFNQLRQLTTVFGLLAAGLAFALQRVVTALAGYVVLLRGKTFNMGDRISMGGVRGDVAPDHVGGDAGLVGEGRTLGVARHYAQHEELSSIVVPSSSSCIIL